MLPFQLSLDVSLPGGQKAQKCFVNIMLGLEFKSEDTNEYLKIKFTLH